MLPFHPSFRQEQEPRRVCVLPSRLVVKVYLGGATTKFTDAPTPFLRACGLGVPRTMQFRAYQIYRIDEAVVPPFPALICIPLTAHCCLMNIHHRRYTPVDCNLEPGQRD